MESGFPGERIIVLQAPMLDLIKDSPLTGDLYIHSLGHFTHARHHAVRRPGGSDSYIFLYCVWGQGYVKTGSRQMTIRANQYIVLPKNVPLEYGSSDDDPWSIYWICFDGEKGKIHAKRMGSPTTVPPSIYTRIEQRTELFDKMYSVLCGEQTIEKIEFADQILPHFLASFSFRETGVKSEDQPRHSEGIINMVLQYMNDNIERKLTMKELADFANMSESYLYRQFSRQMDMAPIDYFIRLKINKAAILLLKTSMSVSQIAAKLGFGSSDYFSRTFKKVIGLSASDFRKQDFRL